MLSQWLTMEHNRMHVVEQWPEGPHKEAALRAIQSSLASLVRAASRDQGLVCLCEVCLNRRQPIATERAA